MRLVDRPYFRPQHCAAIPFLGQSKAGERWIDTGSEMPGFDNHIYLSETAVREAAALLGFPTPEAHAKLAAELSASLAEQLELIDKLSMLETYSTAVDAIRATAT